MAAVRLSARAFAHIERVFEFVAERDPARVVKVVQRLREAILILQHHPLIGRATEHGLRELVISHGRNAYVALYRWYPAKNAVLVLAIRDARQAGYSLQ